MIAAALVPNGPARDWYTLPEVVCGWLHSSEDQWQCDEAPLAPWAR